MYFVEDGRIGGEIRYRVTSNPKELMQVPQEIRKCVAFVGIKESGQIKYAGTAFLVSRVTAVDSTRAHMYAVTAKHVIDGLLDDVDEVCLRLNKKDGTAAWVCTKPSDWISHPSDSSVDVAVIRFVPNPSIFDFMAFPLSSVLTPEIMADRSFGVGDDVFLTGLFHPHSGEKRNIPIVRTGNIAALPEEKVRTKQFGLIDAFLIEARSIGGLSGSPVFLHSSGYRTERGAIMNLTPPTYYLLGLMHGHWDTAVAKVDAATTADKLTEEKVNMGIAIVVPSEKIIEVLSHPKIVSVDGEAERNIMAEKAATAD